MEKKNYYQILGVEPAATSSEIKAAYRRLALLYHPDKNANDKLAEAIFKEINEAYGVLSSKQKRANYHRDYEEANYRQREKGAPFFSSALLLLKLSQMKAVLTQTDPYRMNTDAVFSELQQLFSAFHLAVLKKENNLPVNNEIVATSLSILIFLPGKQQKLILTDLRALPQQAELQITAFEKKQRGRLLWDRYKIWFVLLFTALLCFLLFKVVQMG